MANGLDIGSLVQAAELGRMLSPEGVAQRNLSNQLAQQLAQLNILKAQRDLEEFNNPQAAAMRALQAQLAGKVPDPLSGVVPLTPTEAQIIQEQGSLPVAGAITPTQQAALMAAPTVDEAGFPVLTPVPRASLQDAISGIVGPGGIQTGFGRDLNRIRQGALEQRNIENIINPPKPTAFAPGSYVATPEQVASQTGFFVPERPASAAKLPHIDRGNSIDFVDPLTNRVISSFPKTQNARYEIRSEGVYVEQTPGKGDFKLQGNAPSQTSAAAAYQSERTRRVVADINNLIPRVTKAVTGRTARLQQSKLFPDVLRGDEIVDFEADLASLKSNIFQNELAAMRASSKTGGAVGNVSNREGDKLEAALGALDNRQSDENLVANLIKARDSIEAYNKVLAEQGVSKPAPTGGKKTLSSTNNFPNEEAARAAGFGNGSVVIINGVPGELN